MSTGFETSGELMSALNSISEKFGTLVRNLVKGNMKRADRLSRHALKDLDRFGLDICMQEAIESLASEQAVKSGIINSPSIFPGIGTLITFLMLGTENLVVLEQGIRLSLVLLLMNGFKPDDERIPDRIVGIIGQAYDIIDDAENADPRSITRQYVTKVLPPKYLSKGFNRLLSRIFPTRSKILKLLPVFGVCYAAIEGYTMTVRVGQVAIRNLRGNL